MDPDRRRAPRHQFIADCEVTETASGTRLKGRTSDVSECGCFVDTLNPSPLDTPIRITIFHEKVIFTAFGRVVLVLPNMGMGVKFTSVEQNDLPVLQKWLAGVNHS